MSKFKPKNQNCQFKLKFGTYWNMKNSLVMFIFSVFDRFFFVVVVVVVVVVEKFVPKN